MPLKVTLRVAESEPKPAASAVWIYELLKVRHPRHLRHPRPQSFA